MSVRGPDPKGAGRGGGEERESMSLIGKRFRLPSTLSPFYRVFCGSCNNFEWRYFAYE